MNIKTNDKVIIKAGDDKGRTGKVIKVLQTKLLIEGINIMKKHARPKKEGEKGQIVEKPGPVDVSNVKLICPKCGKPAKVARSEKRKRVCKLCKAEF